MDFTSYVHTTEQIRQACSMNDHWAIYIDIEGFSSKYSKGNDALIALKELMRAIYRIGKFVFPEPPNRLFAHQIGDGFVIISDFHEPNLDRAISIGIVLMKYVTGFNLLARCTIAEGGFSDITGCYPREVFNDCNDGDHSVSRIGSGLMTIFPVMGTALINAAGINKRPPKGPMLIVPQEFQNRFSLNFISIPIECSENISIDWIHSDSGSITEISQKATLKCSGIETIENYLKDYILQNELPCEWRESCQKYLGITHA